MSKSPMELEDKVKMLLGLPPYDGPSNICLNDAYYYVSLKQMYGKQTVDDMITVLRSGK